MIKNILSKISNIAPILMMIMFFLTVFLRGSLKEIIITGLATLIIICFDININIKERK